MATLDDRLAALAAMTPAQLRDAWGRLDRAAPPALPPDLLRLAVAYRLQEKRTGGLGAVAVRELRRVAAGGDAAPRPQPVAVRPGTQLVRAWQGRTYRVVADDDGFTMDGERYASLSAVARAITGARWSGPRFFGSAAHA